MRLLRSNENRVARQIQNTHPSPYSVGVIEENTGGGFFCGKGKGGKKKEIVNTKQKHTHTEKEENGRRSTAAGYEGAEKEKGELCRDKKGGNARGAHEEGLPRPFHARTQEGEKKRVGETERDLGGKEKARQGEKNTGFKEDNDLCLR